MSNSQKQAAFAAMVQQRHEERAAQYARERASAPTVTADHQTALLSDVFRESFGHSRSKPDPGPGERRWERPKERPWDSALRLFADDDTPRPPEPAATGTEPAAAPPPPVPPVQETRVRADEVFASIEARMQPTVEVTDLPPDAQLRRAYRELPGSVREKIAATVEAQDYGLVGYFAGRNFGPDYVSVLVGSALARRFADAQRLQPDLTPAELLRQISEAS